MTRVHAEVTELARVTSDGVSADPVSEILHLRSYCLWFSMCLDYAGLITC